MKRKNFIVSILISSAVLLAGCSEKDNGEEPPVKYSISVDGENGNAYASEAGAQATSAEEGKTITLTAVADDGYDFEGWTVLGGDITLADPSKATTTFTMPARNVSVSAGFVPQAAETFSITLTEDGNGTTASTVDGEEVTTATAGETVTLTAEPNSGFVFLKWIVESGEVTFEDETENPVTFTMPSGDVVIKAEFEAVPAPSYNILISARGNGTVSASVDGAPVTEAQEGTVVDITATVDEGYEFRGWTVIYGNTTISAPASPNSTFVMPAENVSIRAEIYSSVDVLASITDPAFLAYARYRMDNEQRDDWQEVQPKWDTDGDGVLSPQEASNVRAILVKDGYEDVKIESLAGIEHFTSLIELNCSGNLISELDLSNNTSLGSLNCIGNQLSSLDLSKLPWLQYIWCHGNRLGSLDITAISSNYNNDYYLFCGNQTADGTTPRELTLKMRSDQLSNWERYLEGQPENENVTVVH